MKNSIRFLVLGLPLLAFLIPVWSPIGPIAPRPALAITATGTLVLTPTPTPTPTEAHGSGDANKDGDVNALDALLVLQFDAELAALDYPDNCDVDQDGQTNSIDAALILQLDAGLIFRLPA
jgi:hypothetical protein